MEQKKSLIESALLPVSKEQLKQRECCTICIDSIDCVESCAGLCCKQIYHKHCITQWLEKSATCPICGRRVIERSGTSSSSSPMISTTTIISELMRLRTERARLRAFVRPDGTIRYEDEGESQFSAFNVAARLRALDQSLSVFGNTSLSMGNSRAVPVTNDFSSLYPLISLHHAEQLSAHEQRSPSTFSEADIELVMIQTEASREQVIQALEHNSGDIVDAIIETTSLE